MEKANLQSRSIEKELFIKATPERVFQALSEKEGLEHWFLTKAEVDLRLGGAINFEWNRAAGIFNTGTILALDPPRRFSYTWEVLLPGVTTITFDLAAKNDGTLLHLLHTGIGEGEEWDRYYTSRDNGWDVHFTNLTNWLENGIEKPW